MCKEEKQNFIQGTEAQIKTNLISDISVTTPEFSVSGKGMTESFMLNLVRALRGEGTVEFIGEPIKLFDTSKPEETDIGVSKILSDAPISHKVSLAPIKDEIDSEPKISTLKTRPSYKVDTKDGIVHSVGDKNPTIGDKFGDKAKEMYARAGVQHQVQDTDFYHTGIKFTQEGKPKYRCGYECPKCGATGRHYIPFHITRVSCHQCQTALQVDPATKHGLGSSDKFRDEHGNFMIAKVIDMKVETYGKE